jgi:hypothetical protein
MLLQGEVMFRIPLFAAAIGLVSLPALAEETTVWRLFVADHSEPVVTAIDLESQAVLDTFAVGSPASLYVTHSRKAVYAVSGEAGEVAAITTGISLDGHGDHGDIELSAPALVQAAVNGDHPVHFVEHDGQIAIFFDGTGTTSIVSESEWLDGKPQPATHTAAAPHHGVAAVLGEHLLLTEPNPEDPTELPIGINVLDVEGQPVGGLHDCPDLHGEASSGDTLAIACATGLLLVKEAAEGPEIVHLPYAADLPEGKTTTLLGGVGMQYWLGNYGPDKVVIIDPSAETAFRLVDLPSRRVHFAIDPQQAKFAYVFTEDGALQQVNILSGEIAKTLTLTEPYSMDGEWSLPRPRIAVAGNTIAVTDPLKGLIHLVDTASFAKAGELQVRGRPYNIVAAGGSGETHD